MAEPTCPYCAESIPVGARKCPACGENLGVRASTRPAGMSRARLVLIALGAVVGLCVLSFWASIVITGNISASRHYDEAAAIGSLKTIGYSQVIFREGDKEQDGKADYGSLQELSNAGLVDGILGSGTKQGYCFSVYMPPQTAELLWMATATPLRPGPATGGALRYFATNQEGVIYYSSTAPFSPAPDCAMPPSALPVGK